MRYFLFSSIIFLLFSCSSGKRLNNDANQHFDRSAILSLKLKITANWYTATVDAYGNHLSGLLLFKQMEDSSIRVVFTNEIGFTFFDFQFEPNGNFKVHRIMDKLNRKAVLKTLREDFELILMNTIAVLPYSVILTGEKKIHRFQEQNLSIDYLTDSTTTQIMLAKRSKADTELVEAVFYGKKDSMPDSIGLSHKNFSLNIGLKRILK